MTAPTAFADSPKDWDTPAARWLAEIEKAQKERDSWWKTCHKIRDRYRDDAARPTEGDQQFGQRFNILWSNIQTLQPALFAATPNVVVERRWGDADPVGRTACVILRRATQYQLDQADFTHLMKQVVRDHLLYGQGTMWARYVPHFDKRPIDWPIGGGAFQPTPPGAPQPLPANDQGSGPGLTMGPTPMPPTPMPAVGSALPSPPTPAMGLLSPGGASAPGGPSMGALPAPMAPPLGGMPPKPPMPPPGPPGPMPGAPPPMPPTPPPANDQQPPAQIGAMAPGEGLAGMVVGDIRDDEAKRGPLSGNVQIHDEGEDEPEFLAWEEVKLDHVGIEDWLCSPCRTWQEARWVARRSYMTKDQLKARFGARIANQVELDWTPQDLVDDDKALAPQNQIFRRAQVWEIWDRQSRKVLWMAPSFLDKLLDEREDPLRLANFFPCPRPLWATVTTDSTVPVPDYWLYKDQALAIDNLTARIDAITRVIKVTGVYDAAQPDIQRMFAEGVENALVPVTQWGVFSDQGGLKGCVDVLDVSSLSATLQTLVEVRTQAKNDLYEVTGISDIIRGTSAASETATAQQIKSGFGTMRLRARQNNVARFCRDVINIVAEIVCEHFQPRTLRLMSDIDNYASPQDAALAPQALALLRDDKTRPLRIDIEADSTTLSNQAQEQQSRIQFLAMAGQFLQQVVPAAVQTPQLGPLLANMLLFGIRAFPQGAELEAHFEKAAKALEDAAQAPRPTPPDPKMLEAQAKVAKTKSDIQNDAAESAREDKRLMLDHGQAVVNAGVDIAKAHHEHALAEEDQYHARHDAEREHLIELAKIRQQDEAQKYKDALQAWQAHEDSGLKRAQFILNEGRAQRQEDYGREDADNAHKVAMIKARQRPKAGGK